MTALALSIALIVSVIISIIGCVIGSISHNVKFLYPLADTLVTLGEIATFAISFAFVTLPNIYVLVALIVFVVITIIGGILLSFSKIIEGLKYTAIGTLTLGGIETFFVGIAWLLKITGRI